MTVHMRNRAMALMTGLFLVAATAAPALEAVKGDVILTVTGTIAQTNAEAAAQFDLAMLQALDPVTVETTTIWTDGVQTFVGVELATLLAVLGAEGRVLKASAINDYAVEIPVSDAVPGGPIIAYLSNGAPMSVRDKGPLWVIYPFDASPAYQTEEIYSRSIWQLDRIEVQP